MEGNSLRAVIEVRDKGPGVPEASLADLFCPFYRVGDARDRKQGGTGLGLAITERAVKTAWRSGASGKRPRWRAYRYDRSSGKKGGVRSGKSERLGDGERCGLRVPASYRPRRKERGSDFVTLKIPAPRKIWPRAQTREAKRSAPVAQHLPGDRRSAI